MSDTTSVVSLGVSVRLTPQVECGININNARSVTLHIGHLAVILKYFISIYFCVLHDDIRRPDCHML